MTNPDLSPEILLEIFARTPAKSVGKCRTLSNYWNTNLSTPNFVKKHLTFRKRAIQSENVVLITQSNGLGIITSPTTGDEVFKDNSERTDEWWFVSGSCNGLVLIHGSQGLILMNPITLKQVTIPRLYEPAEPLKYYDVALGYDSSTDDYKIVEIHSCNPKNKNADDRLRIIDIYSVKNGVWRTLDDNCYPYSGLGNYAFQGGAFCNGALHWLLFNEQGYLSCIAAFDLATEVFSEIPLPKEFVCERGYRYNGVSVVGGCLSIVDHPIEGVTDVWRMKEYGVGESWIKFRIQAENGNSHSIVVLLCYVEDGELLLLPYWNFLFVCDPKSGKMRKVVLGERNRWFKHGKAFVDSLVSPIFE